MLWRRGLFGLVCGTVLFPPSWGLSILAGEESGATLPSVAFERRLERLRLPTDAIRLNNELYVVDEKANEVAVYDSEGALVRHIGSIGSGPGEFLHPTRIAADSSGTLYIYDYGNERIQALDRIGRHLASLPLFDFQGFDATPTGEVLIGNPGAGALVEAYDGRDGKLKRKFGELRKVSDFYGDARRDLDEANKLVINRVFIAADKRSNVYLTFRFAPVVQKYNAQGGLIWEKRLSGALVDKAADRFITDAPGADNYIKTTMDGRAANLVCLGAAHDAQWDRLFVLLPGFAIAAVDAEGKQLPTWKPVPADSQAKFIPFGAAWAGGGELILVDIFERVIWIGQIPNQGGSQ